MTPISDEFAQKMRTIYEGDGQLWLSRLPQIIRDSAEKWQLSVEGPVENLSYNYIVRATQRDGTPVILKIGFPARELFTEIETLDLFQGKGMVKMLAVDKEKGAFLLERILPGNDLSTLKNDDEATRIIGGLIERLRCSPPDQHNFPHLLDWSRALERYLSRFPDKNGPIPSPFVQLAAVYFREFQAQAKPDFLLHGDLHHFNVLRGDGARWVVIDPKGVIGQRPFETARFLHNPYPKVLAASDLKRLIQRRVDIICELLPFDRQEVLVWGLCDAILSAVWSVEDGEKSHLVEMVHFAECMQALIR